MTLHEILQLVREENPVLAKLSSVQIEAVLERRVAEWAATHRTLGS